MESLLSKYGFHFQAFSPKLIEELIKSSSFEHVEEIASYIDNSKSLSFLKDYTIVRGNSPLDKQIQEAEEENKRNEKLYKKLGTITGLALVIMLF